MKVVAKVTKVIQGGCGRELQRKKLKLSTLTKKYHLFCGGL